MDRWIIRVCPHDGEQGCVQPLACYSVAGLSMVHPPLGTCGTGNGAFKAPPLTGGAFFMCAQHGRTPAGASPAISWSWRMK